jgi:hypothetical protein
MATATTNPQARADAKEGGQNSNNSRFMFVEFSAPAAPVPKGTKKRRGGPSEVRAHITKEYHRKLRVKRLGAPRIIGDAESIVDGNDEEERIVLPERTRSGKPDSITPLVGAGDIQDQTERTRRGSNMSRASSLSAPSAVAMPPSPKSEITRKLSMSPKLRNQLGEGRLDPFDALPAQGMPLFIHRVLDHGRFPHDLLDAHHSHRVCLSL